MRTEMIMILMSMLMPQPNHAGGEDHSGRVGEAGPSIRRKHGRPMQNSVHRGSEIKGQLSSEILRVGKLQQLDDDDGDPWMLLVLVLLMLLMMMMLLLIMMITMTSRREDRRSIRTIRKI